MGQIREIKCPACGDWTMWRGDIDDRCLHCNSFLEPNRFSREIEKKISKEITKEHDFFFIKSTDGTFKRELKLFFNSFRWVVYYLQIIFIGFVSLLLVLLSLLTG